MRADIGAASERTNETCGDALVNPDPSSLHRLRGPDRQLAPSPSAPMPRRRWLLRGGVPLSLMTAMALLLAWSLRDTLVPIPVVDVAPVIAVEAGSPRNAMSGGATSREPKPEPQIVAQSPGWVEPEPFAVTVQSMVPGVVERVLVLEGQRVVAGDELVHLVRVDGELALRRALAELAELEAEVQRAHASVDTAMARAAEVQEEIARLRPLAEAGGAPISQVARLESRLRTHQHEIAAERATVERAKATVEIQRVAIAEAELSLDRKIVRAPVDGVVLARSVVPGTRIAFAGDGPGEAHEPGLLSIYDPSRLQVRADVPLGDAGKIGLGTRARITTEAMPDRVFTGEVIRVLHKADLQRNTVQAKVRIEDPDPQLKPEMLVRVRFLGTVDERLDGGSSERGGERRGVATDDSAVRLWIPELALHDRDGSGATVWTAAAGSRRGVSKAMATRITIVSQRDGGAVVAGALRPGDRVVISRDVDLHEGMAIRTRETSPALSGSDPDREHD